MMKISIPKFFIKNLHRTIKLMNYVAAYVKKPVTVEAVFWDGTDECLEAISVWMGEFVSFKAEFTDEREIHIHTLEGIMTAKAGCYIIRGLEGEFYPCDFNVFKKSYTPQGDSRINVAGLLPTKIASEVVGLSAGRLRHLAAPFDEEYNPEVASTRSKIIATKTYVWDIDALKYALEHRVGQGARTDIKKIKNSVE